MTDRIRKLRDLFERALDLPESERAAFAHRECGGDDRLQRELLALLSHDDDTFEPIVDVTPSSEGDPRDESPALSPGRRLGPYEVIEAVGSGGMGEVYRARDTRLDRTVAVKVLRRRMTQEPGVRERFDREARFISQLSHPNICALYDVGHEHGIDFLVMEFLEGETLAQRVRRGRIRLSECLDIAAQIAGALDAAHRQSLTHRDLKPGNVMLTRSGVKLLDFGIARLGEPTRNQSNAANTSMPTASLTGENTIGTLHYMAPEQVEGRVADARTDIWALGMVIREMVTGSRTFEADSTAGLAAAILEHDPKPMRAVLPETPPVLERLVERCLAKKPDARWQSARDLQLELTWLRDRGVVADGDLTPRPGPAGERFVWSAVVLALVIALGVFLFRPVGHSVALRPAHFSLPPPAGTEAMSVQVSPNGRYVSIVGWGDEHTRLWLRPLDGTSARPLPGTEGARYFHFWSPDSRFIAFFADGQLKRVDIEGGPAQVLSDVPGTGPLQAGSWSRDGAILFDVLEVPGKDGLYRLPVEGGDAVRLTVVDEMGTELRPLFPSFLPDGRHFLFVAAVLEPGRDFDPLGLYVASTRGGRAKRVMDVVSHAQYVEPGYLVYVQDGTLLARPFDLGELRLYGEPVSMADRVGMFSGVGVPSFSASTNGVLAYTTTGDQLSHLQWLDRSGKPLGDISRPAQYGDVRLSPDEEHLAVFISDPLTSTSDLWLIELDRQATTRFTSGARSISSIVWAPDGRRIAFSMPRGAPPFMHVKSLDGGEASVLLPSNGRNQWPWDWSADGRFVLFGDRDEETNWDIWMLPLEGDRSPSPVLRTRFRELEAQLSPDEQWMAFVSEESGTPQVYVQRFPDSGDKRRISLDGGDRPRWRGDGRELFYLNGEGALVAVDMQLGENAEVGGSRVLFREPGMLDYDVSGDGQRFVVNSVLGGAVTAAPPVHVLMDWTARLPE